MKTQCPHCRTFFNIKVEYLGKKARCKKCVFEFVLYDAKIKAAPDGLNFTAPETQESGLGLSHGLVSADLANLAVPQESQMAVVSGAQAGPVMLQMPVSAPMASFNAKTPPLAAKRVDFPLPDSARKAILASAFETSIPPKALPAERHTANLPPKVAVEAIKTAQEKKSSIIDGATAKIEMKNSDKSFTLEEDFTLPKDLFEEDTPDALGVKPLLAKPVLASSTAQTLKLPFNKLAKSKANNGKAAAASITKNVNIANGSAVPGKTVSNFESTIVPPQPIQRPKALRTAKAIVPPGTGLKKEYKSFNTRSGFGLENTSGIVSNNIPQAHIAPTEMPSTALKKRKIPSSWVASLPTNVLIDGQAVSDLANGDINYEDTYFAPLPLDVKSRAEDWQAVTLEIYDAPISDEKKIEERGHLIASSIELDENLPKDDGIDCRTCLDFKNKNEELALISNKSLIIEAKFSSLVKDEFKDAVFLSQAGSLSGKLWNPVEHLQGEGFKSSISLVERLPLNENESLKIGPVEILGQNTKRIRTVTVKQMAQLPPLGLRPPMFPRTQVGPDNLLAPEFLQTQVVKKTPGLSKTAFYIFKTVFRAFKSVFLAIYWAWRRQFDKIPKPVLTSSLACLLIGLLLGGFYITSKSSVEIKDLQLVIAGKQELLDIQQSSRIKSLYQERDRLREDMLRLAALNKGYSEGSIPQALALAASEEFKIADALLLQQIAAIESGAKVTVSVKQTSPDPDLARTLAEEMARVQADLQVQLQTSQTLNDKSKRLADASVAAQLVNLAILNRNHLIAKYGLNSPAAPRYQNSLSNPSDIDMSAVNTLAAVEANELKPDVPGLLDELRIEVDRLRAENELLLNSDSSLYASAVSDMGLGHFVSAKDKFSRLIKVYPRSKLIPNANEGLAQVKVMTARREALKRPPVQVASTKVIHDGGYLRNETYVRVNFRNVSSLMIKKLEFQVLTFDEHGYPVASQRLGMTEDNTLSVVMNENVPSGSNEYIGSWELSEKVKQVKVKLKEVEFFDMPTWRDDDIGRWVEKEGVRFNEAEGKRS